MYAVAGNDVRVVVDYSPVARDPGLAGSEVSFMARLFTDPPFAAAFELDGEVYVLVASEGREQVVELDKVDTAPLTALAREAGKVLELGRSRGRRPWISVKGFSASLAGVSFSDTLTGCVESVAGRHCSVKDVAGLIRRLGRRGYDVLASWVEELDGLIDTLVIGAGKLVGVARWGVVVIEHLLGVEASLTLVGPYGMVSPSEAGNPVAYRRLGKARLGSWVEPGRGLDRPEAWALFWCAVLARDAVCRGEAVERGDTIVFTFEYDGRGWRLELPWDTGAVVAASMLGRIEMDEGTVNAAAEASKLLVLKPYSPSWVARAARRVRGRGLALLLSMLARSALVDKAAANAIREVGARVVLAGRHLNELGEKELTMVLTSALPGALGLDKPLETDTIYAQLGSRFVELRVSRILDSVFGRKLFSIGLGAAGKHGVVAVTVEEALKTVREKVLSRRTGRSVLQGTG